MSQERTGTRSCSSPRPDTRDTRRSMTPRPVLRAMDEGLMTNQPTAYIDGFLFPLAKAHLNEYRQVAEQVAAIWKEHGALAYCEYVGDDLKLEGTRSFLDAVEVGDEEVIVFGWVEFPSREVRDRANARVPKDPRMAALVEPLVRPGRIIFDATRMVYGGFEPLVRTGG